MRAITILLLALAFQSCAPAVVGLSTKGRIIKSEDDRVFVLFEEELGESGRFTGSWFHFPGAGQVDGKDYEVKVVLVQVGSGELEEGSTKTRQCKIKSTTIKPQQQ